MGDYWDKYNSRVKEEYKEELEEKEQSSVSKEIKEKEIVFLKMTKIMAVISSFAMFGVFVGFSLMFAAFGIFASVLPDGGEKNSMLGIVVAPIIIGVVFAVFFYYFYLKINRNCIKRKNYTFAFCLVLFEILLISGSFVGSFDLEKVGIRGFSLFFSGISLCINIIRAKSVYYLSKQSWIDGIS